MNPIAMLYLAPAPAPTDEGSTRPFIVPLLCARLAYSVLALLLPEIAIAASVALASLSAQAAGAVSA